MTYKQEQCINCSVLGAESPLGLCDKCRSDIADLGGFSTVKMTKLYGISKGQLKKLKKSNELIPRKLENGNWQYSIKDIERFLTNNPQRIKTRNRVKPLKPEVLKNISVDVAITSNKDAVPTEANSFYDFDIVPGKDTTLISKPSACKEFNLSSSQFDEILKNFSIYQSKKGRNTLYSALQIIDAINSSSIKNGKWSPNFTKCRECESISKHHYASGFCVDCYPGTLEYSILKEYLTGRTFAEIGRDNNISRERVRQLFEKAVLNEAENIAEADSENKNEEIASIREAIKEEARKNSFRRRCQDDIKNSLEKIYEVLNTTNTSSPKVLLNRVNITPGASFIIEEDYPEISKKLFMNGNRWSMKYDKCAECGTTEQKHESNGLCKSCYTKSAVFRETQMKWRKNNYEKFRASQKKYEQEYYKRPEVKERLKKVGHQRRFGSQIRRDTAIKQYGNKCSDCGISRTEHKRQYEQDLSVLHLDGNLRNNELDNLKPFCRSCAAKMARFINLNKS